MDDTVSIVLQMIQEANPDALSADGFDSCLIGIAYRACGYPVLCYNQNAVIRLLMNRDHITEEEAVEFYKYNILGAYMGENAPIFVEIPPD